MRSTFVLLFTILVGVVALPQGHPQFARERTLCGDAATSMGCASFVEMFDHRDKEILDSFGENYQSYVCFSNDADEFFVIQFSEPDKALAKKGATEKSFEELGREAEAFTVRYTRYKGGVSDRFYRATGKWTWAGDTPSFETSLPPAGTPLRRRTQASIDSREISFSYQFENVSNTVTTIEVTVRRSTKRFVEMLSAPSAERSKQQSKTIETQSSSGGYCVYSRDIPASELKPEEKGVGATTEPPR